MPIGRSKKNAGDAKPLLEVLQLRLFGPVNVPMEVATLQPFKMTRFFDRKRNARAPL